MGHAALLMLIRISAPHFCAGIVLDGSGHVVEAAPILQWTLGKHSLLGAASLLPMEAVDGRALLKSFAIRNPTE